MVSAGMHSTNKNIADGPNISETNSVGSTYDNDVQTTDIVADIINYWLVKKKLTWEFAPHIPEPQRVNLFIRILCEEFDRRYRSDFENLSRAIDVTPTTAYSVFHSVVGELFRDGIRWGRIIALLTFGSTLAEKCCKKGYSEQIAQIHMWTTKFIEDRLKSWIVENGGWNGMTQHFESLNGDTPVVRHDSPEWGWTETLRPYIITAIGVGVLGALGALIARK